MDQAKLNEANDVHNKYVVLRRLVDVLNKAKVTDSMSIKIRMEDIGISPVYYLSEIIDQPFITKIVFKAIQDSLQKELEDLKKRWDAL